MKIAVDWCEQVTLELVKNHDPARRLSIPPDKRRSAATMAKGVLYALRQGNVPLEAFQRMQAIAWRTPFWRQAVADMPSWVSGARFCELYNAWRVTRQASEMPPAPLSEAEKAALFAKPEAVKR